MVAPPQMLTASWLVGKADLASVVQTSGLEDDGGVSNSGNGSNSNGFESTAVTATQQSRLKIQLTTYSDAASAHAGFQGAIGAFSTPTTLTGVGDMAAAEDQLTNIKGINCLTATVPSDLALCVAVLSSRGGTSVATGAIAVLKGAQVLTVSSAPLASVQAQIQQALQAGSLSSVITQLQAISSTQPLSAARALTAHLSGQPASGRFVQLPPGAVNPCLISTTKLGGKLKSTVTAANAPLQQVNSPAQECDYTVGGYPYLVQVETESQAEHSVPPTTLAAIYAADLSTGGHANLLQQTSGPDQAFMVPGQDWTFEMLLARNGASAASTTLPNKESANVDLTRALPSAGAGATTALVLRDDELIRVEDGRTFAISERDCFAISDLLGTSQLKKYTDAYYSALLVAADRWCGEYFPRGPGPDDDEDPSATG